MQEDNCKDIQSFFYFVSPDSPWFIWLWYYIQTLQCRVASNSSPLETSNWVKAYFTASKSLEDCVWFILHWEAMDLKKKCPLAMDESEYGAFISHLTPAWVREKNALPTAFPADGKQYEVIGRSSNALAWATTVRKCNKITVLLMERGRKAFEAISDNQNSTKPREGEETKSKGGSW